MPRTLSTAVALRWNEKRFLRFTGHWCEGLHDFGRMAVTGRREATHGTGTFGMMAGGCGPVSAFAAADLDLADDVPGEVDEAAMEQGIEGQGGSGGIAAHTADIVCVP